MRVCPACKKEFDNSVKVCPDDGSATAAKGAEKKAAEDPLLGKMVGSYKLIRMIGKGGMGSVYAAEHPAIGSKVAVKFLHPQFAEDRLLVTRFFNEAKAVNLIKHDNIIQVVDYMFLDETTPCFVMEYLERGYPLNRLPKPAGLEVAGPILLQMCDALAAAHDKQIIHRDLKPDNVFLTVRNHRKHFVKLMDFGIAKLQVQGDDQGKTQTGTVLGTPAYMSPEQAAGKVNEIGPASDIYSLGVIMYALATGTVPFKGSFGEVVAGHLFHDPTPPRSIVPEIPEAYEKVILKALSKKPEDRFATMRDVLRAVHEVMVAQGVSMELPLADDEESAGTIPAAGPSLVTPSSLGQLPRPSLTPAKPPTQVRPAESSSSTEAATVGATGAAAAAPVPGKSAPWGLIAAMVVAFLIGFAAPVALVKGGVLGPKAAPVAQAAP